MTLATRETLPRREFAAGVSLLWPAILALVAAILALLVCHFVGFHGFDRLLPEGAPFQPYFIT